MRPERALLSLLVCAATSGVLLGCEIWQNARAKEECALLQRLEYEHRASPVSGMEVVETSGYVAAGFRAHGRDENVWIPLNPRYSPSFKQVPEAPFTITRQDLENLRRTRDISKDVLAALEARVSGPGS